MLVGVDLGEYDCEASLDELEELAKTAGAEVEARVTQRRETPDSATFIGSGRLREIKDFCADNDVDLLIFDSELTPSQQRNIEDITDVRVVDRTQLILDIFAARARSGEGKLQVELAQLKYLLPRLGGKGTSMSRLGGGIGTRGPGETKLESDRRHIRRRIKNLEDGLEALSRRRKLARERREKDEVETVAIVGYTNAGKSTLMNMLSGIYFLPHGLVEAFKSTLEEAASATLILNVCDASSPDCAEHLEVTNRLLEELGCKGKPIIAVFNKCDAAPDLSWLSAGLHSVKISALTGEGLDRLLNEMVRALPPTRKKVTLLLPYSMGSDAALLREKGALDREEYRPDGLKMTVTADAKLLERYKDYIV